MNFDQIAAQSVNNQGFESGIHTLLERSNEVISQKAAELQEKIAATEALGASLPAEDAEGPPLTVDVISTATSQLDRKRQDLEKAEHTKQIFAARHSLSRPANTPDCVLTIVLLGVMGFIEGAINAAFFQNAHMVAGPAAALLTSLLISFTNVTVSACGGFFIGRWLNYGALAIDGDAHQFSGKRLMAKASFYVFVLVMGWFHLTVGLIRTQEELLYVQHSPDAYLQLLATPEALFLVLIGAAMSILSWSKGKHGFDDPYPYYGAMQRKVDDLHDECLDIYEDAQSEIADRFDDAISDLEKVEKNTAKLYDRYNDAVKQCQRAEVQFQATVRQVEGQLRKEIAQMMALYLAHKKRRTEPDVSEYIERVSTLSGTLQFSLPPHRQPPEIHSQKSHLREAKENALNGLAQLIQSQQ